MSEVSFHEESVKDTWEEASALTIANHAETGQLDGATFGPNREFYEVAQDRGLLRVFTMRDERGNLAGYYVGSVYDHHQYTNAVVAFQDSLYVTPARRGIDAVRFIRWQDETLSYDARYSFRQVPATNDYSRTLIRMDYAPREQAFVKRLR